MRGVLALFGTAILVVAFLPAMVCADASVVQDSCIAVGIPPNANVWTYFTVVNFSLPAQVCDLHFLPEPQPPLSGCVMNDVVAPEGWSVFLNPVGGADWFANTPADCIDPGTSKGSFGFLLDPDFCCYIVQFTDPTGAVILEQEGCFTCQKVPVEERTWGHIKQLYE
jgi:hypothetical protein